MGELMKLEDIPPYFGGACACAECTSGTLRGGSLRAWEEAAGIFCQNGVVAKGAVVSRRATPSKWFTTECCGWQWMGRSTKGRNNVSPSPEDDIQDATSTAPSISPTTKCCAWRRKEQTAPKRRTFVPVSCRVGGYEEVQPLVLGAAGGPPRVEAACQGRLPPSDPPKG